MNKVKFLWLLIIAIFMMGACAGHQKVETKPTVNKAGVVALPALHGVNLDGAEFGSAYPGTEGTDYIFPTTQEIDYWAGKGANVIRLNFQWERAQPSAKGPFATTYFNKYSVLVRYATSKGVYVLLNPQNFARYYGNVVGSFACPNDVFADFWSRMANAFKDDPKVIFGLVNEPNTMATEQWVSAANSAIAAIRATGSTNIISTPGNGWTGMSGWFSNWYGTSNSIALLNVVDSGNNFVYEIHHYFDSDASGGYTSGDCVSETIGVDQAKPVVSWLRTNGKKAFIAEYGAPNTTKCKNAITNYLTYVQANSDVLLETSWWSGGANGWWWNYILSLEPTGLGTSVVKDAPQTSWITPFFTTSTPTPTPTPTTTTPPPTSNFSTSVNVYTKWSSGMCATVYIKNNATANLAWHDTVVSLNTTGSLRDYWNAGTKAVWGAKGKITFTPKTWNLWIKSKQTINFGFCMDTQNISELPFVVSIE